MANIADQRTQKLRASLRSERGDLPAVLILVLVVVLLVEFIIFTGRIAGARADIAAAAAEAARAGSVAADAAGAVAVVEPAALAVLDQRGVPCTGARAEHLPESVLVSGGVIAVRVHCTVQVADLGFITQLVPIGDIELSGASFESIDPLRVFGT